MDKRLEEIRKRLKYYRDTEGIFTDKMFSRAGEYANAVIDELLDLVDTQAKHVEEGREIVEDWVVTRNSCEECGMLGVDDDAEPMHEESCKVDAWLKVTG